VNGVGILNVDVVQGEGLGKWGDEFVEKAIDDG
jgi:hypothetical protein